jgi:hypothetical protein
MIKILGTQRIIILLFLAMASSLLATLLYLYAIPERAKKEAELSSLRGQIATVISDIGKLQIEFDQLAKQQVQFDGLRGRGFFGSQDRREAEIVFKDIQRESGVISASVNLKPGVIEDNEEAQKAEYKILSSPATIVLTSMDDIDVFRYIYLLEKYFPGHVSVESVRIERAAEISATVLRGIATGISPPLVKTEIGITWRTMMPAADVIGASTAPVEGG